MIAKPHCSAERSASAKGGGVGAAKTAALGVLLAAVVCAVIWGILKFGGGKEVAEEKKKPANPTKIVERTPEKAPGKHKAQPKKEAKDPLDDPKWDGLDKTRIKKAANGKYVYLPKKGEERFPGERAQALALIGGLEGSASVDKRLVEDPEHPWMVHNMVQSDLVQYARPGEFAVPINPNISDDAAWEAIRTPIKLHYNDTDRQIEEKQYVRDILDDLRAYMEKGGHARDYFAELHHRQEMETDLMLKTRQNVHEILNSGDVEGARAALEAYNRVRREKGLPEMRVRKLNGPSSIPRE